MLAFYCVQIGFDKESSSSCTYRLEMVFQCKDGTIDRRDEKQIAVISCNAEKVCFIFIFSHPKNKLTSLKIDT